jgi:hypothetical protein
MRSVAAIVAACTGEGFVCKSHAPAELLSILATACVSVRLSTGKKQLRCVFDRLNAATIAA